MAKGFKDSSGKFHPTGNNGTSSRDKSISTSGVKIQPLSRIQSKFTEEDIEGGREFFDNFICEHPQEWLQIIDQDKYPFSKKTHDNLWDHNMCGWAVWDDDEGRYANDKEVRILSDRDKDSIIRYWIDEKKEEELERKSEREFHERLENKVRNELSEATGVDIAEIHGSETAMMNFQIEGYEGNHAITTVLPFSLTPDKLKEMEKQGYEILSVGNGIKVKKGGFE